jgi:VanZ family protein
MYARGCGGQASALSTIKSCVRSGDFSRFSLSPAIKIATTTSKYSPDRALGPMHPQSPIGALRSWLWRWLPPLLWMGLIFFLSAQPDLPHAPGEWLDAVLKKFGHAAEYLLLFCMLLRAWRYSRSPAKALDAALLATALYAVSDELHQAFVPGRHANWYDVLIDVGLPLLLWRVWRGRLRGGLLRSEDEYLAE